MRKTKIKMVLKKSKIKIPYIRLNFRIVRQSDAQWCERSKYLIHKMRYFSYSIYLTKLLDPLVSSERIAPGVIIKEMRFYIECD